MSATEPWDHALAAAIERPEHTLTEVAAATGAPAPLLEGLVRTGLLTPHEGLVTTADVDAVRMGMALLETGIPLAELLDLARRAHEALLPLAADAVELFVRFIRDAAAAGSDDRAAETLLAAFVAALPAGEGLVASHFRALVLAEARRRAAG